MGRIKNLTFLSINSLMINPKQAELILNLKGLQYLNIGRNNIDDATICKISKMDKLTSLNIESIHIGIEGFKAVCGMKQLTALYTCFNVEVHTNDVVKLISLSLPNLTLLDIQASYLKEQEAKYLSQLVNLKSLNVRFNFLGDEGMQYISKLENLTFLNIAHNIITPEGARQFKELKHLTNLNLKGCGLGEKGFEALKINELCNLTILNISANNIGLKQVQFICKMTQLISLDISENLIDIDGSQIISERLLNLRELVMDEIAFVEEEISNMPRLISVELFQR